MRISMDLSLYPLDDNYKPAIRAFITDLQSYPDLIVQPNRLSTQIFGEYELVMRAMQESLKRAFESGAIFSLVTKTLNVDRSDS